MATNEEDQLNNNEEPKIPVFTVLKNGAILKNIFIVNNKSPPPPFSLSNLPRTIKFVQESENPNDQENEEVLTVGRHPDCNIMLTHPSISRFHLQIVSNSSLQKLSVVDLSSVHGSWVSEKRIEPWVRTELEEGDTLKIGGSSRVYKLHWIPLSQAYDFENPYVSLSDVSMNEEKREENLVTEKENVAEVYQDEIYIQMEDKCTQEIESLEVVETKKEDKGEYEGSYSLLVEDIEVQHLAVENVNSISSDENLGLIVKEGVPSAPLMPESPIYALFDENEEDSDSLLKEFGEQNVNSISSDGNLGLIVKEGVPSAPLMPESPIYALFDENEEDSDGLLKEFGEQNEAWSICTGPSEIRSVNFNLPAEEYISETWSLEFDKENECLQPHFATDMDPEIRGVEENESNLFMDLGSYSIEKEEGNCAGECILETESPECGVGNHFLQSHSVADMVSEIREATSRTKNESNLIKNLDSLSLIEQKVVDQCAAKLAVPSGGESLNSLLSIEEYISEAPSPDCEVCEAELPEGENTSNHVNFNPLYSIELKEEVDCASEPIGDLFSPVTEALEESEAQKVDKENQSPEPFKVLQYLSQGAKQDNTLLEEKLCSSFNFNSVVTYEGGHPAAENHKGRDNENILPFMAEYVNSGITDDKGSHAPQSLLVELRKTEETKRSLVKSDTTSSFHNIWSRRGKPGNVLHIQTDKSRRNTVEAGLDMELKQCNEEDAEEKSNFNENFSSLDVEDIEIFTPDKENLTPNTLLQQSLKKKGKLKEVKNSKISKSSSAKVTFNHNIHFKEDFTASCGKEKRTSKVLQEQMCHLEKRKPFGDLAMDEQGKIKRPERVPFQSLIANAAVKSRSDIFGYSAKFHQTSKKNNVVQEKNNKSWTMVVDTASLLNKDSRKSLQLLQGLKGTFLIIPRMVIRELDCLKRKGSLFKRKTKASFVLEWIEECLVKTSWWIHVQSSGEDRRLTAATPPASPQSLCPTNIGHFCYETTTNSLAFSSQRSSSEILSPTAEDHILDCALLYRKMKRDGQLVLLSNDVTLKIKAMAEGLLCETVQEFRESLVNPFSERFLWADSSPRGLTWSYLDDAMLREKYNNHCPSRKSSNAESAKGLKLILLHNSHYGQITPTRPAEAT